MAMIKKVTRGQIAFEYDGKTGVIEGEAYLRGHGSPDFVIYASSFQSWSPPDETELVDDDTRKKVLDALVKAMKIERKMTAEVE